MHSILLIGQSNMAGRGVIEDAPILENQDKIYVARNCKWVNFFRPINPDRKFSGVSLAEKFADLYASEHNVEVGLIPCADGGTRIDQWLPNEVLFENAVNCAKLCQKTSTLVAILWHQGEGDCKEECHPVYLEKLKIVMTELRARLGSDIPIIVGGLGDFLINYPGISDYYQIINEKLEQLPNVMSRVAFVSAKGLTDKGDSLHFNTNSLMEFGKRYYNAFKSIENSHLTKDQTQHKVSITEIEKL